MPDADQTTTKPQPLAGYRVLDLSQVMAGPFGCMLLGDMGADVIKVEPPRGDQTRGAMGFRMKGDDSPGFLALNRNKRSIALDLKSEAGREVFLELVRTADVLVENFRPGVAARLGVDYATLSAIRPELVYASISGFGQTGPWAARPGFDLIAQAMSGVMSAMGHPETGPVKSGVSVGDLGAGLFSIYGILSALIGRQTSGKGQYIDASLFESALALSIWETTEFWATGQSPKPLGTANRMSAPYQAFEASDGMFVVGAANEKLWEIFCKVIDRPELRQDPAFALNGDRVRNREALAATLQPTFRTRTAAEWVDAFLAAGVPAGPINDFRQVFEADHTRARDMVMEIDHPAEGPVKTLGFPVKLSDTPQQVRHPAPLLAQHRQEVLEELGLGTQADDLERRGAFG
ncbi:L-carnitine dehydratase/bile acid-inducible protein F [Oceanicola granulosus HTCC2516]|uniref:L-carnitine dehydratase/bile acid-inducible protein F n=1 Tax=Oceanicola granulosus (strain ATCC BAA-861 / DSM 15982 / KCTC 12143 / HTCC2516) TaxID=314256 RepID=Q2CHC1_OCEGH|nr:CoA transferase [Oceanicola granulosus]EAR52118.1 L-carnitine dehydratase/bile acid-inducible protein F [Oceanicola granulosus HTCC2516]